MNKKRKVFLFGSGATLAWNSPTTDDLTKLIRNSGFKTNDNKTFITEFIYQKLLANGYESNDINFETIINVIEEFIVYYSQFNESKKLPSLLNCFFNSIYPDELLNFSIKGGKREHGFEIQVPKGPTHSASARLQRVLSLY